MALWVGIERGGAERGVVSVFPFGGKHDAIGRGGCKGGEARGAWFPLSL